jgi:sec-independent protein translocase protein TatB
MFGLTIEKFLVVAAIAAFVIGPERLPAYATKLADIVRGLRNLTASAKSHLATEYGDDGLDWKRLDPRQYDPRHIIRQALEEDEGGAAAASPSDAATVAARVDDPASTTPSEPAMHREHAKENMARGENELLPDSDPARPTYVRSSSGHLVRA